MSRYNGGYRINVGNFCSFGRWDLKLMRCSNREITYPNNNSRKFIDVQNVSDRLVLHQNLALKNPISKKNLAFNRLLKLTRSF